ncbi:hypothetical protein PIB30_058379 [Stylosanthes scabra]|uniref:Uncharacterized protein n=1 Tax=Stylosanthes scabra TaxID=79078 RepID=A0ABU6XL74_9FABA|nr:hypothetical protein [Stylosanthes scabra]
MTSTTTGINQHQHTRPPLVPLPAFFPPLLSIGDTSSMDSSMNFARSTRFDSATGILDLPASSSFFFLITKFQTPAASILRQNDVSFGTGSRHCPPRQRR